MKILITANVLGNFKELKKDAEFSKVNQILIAGNVGIREEGEFKEFLDGKLEISQDIFCVTGKYEDFSFIKTHDYLGVNILPEGPSTLDSTPYSLEGVSGTYSPNFYEKDSAPPKHMTKKSLFGIRENADIVLLHNVPGQLAKSGSLDFHDDVFNFIEAKAPRYIFIGGYDRFSHFKYYRTTVLFLGSLRRGYALVDTKDWSCFIQHKIS